MQPTSAQQWATPTRAWSSGSTAAFPPDRLAARLSARLGTVPPVSQRAGDSAGRADSSDFETSRIRSKSGSAWGAACEPLSVALWRTGHRGSHCPAESEPMRFRRVEEGRAGRLSAFVLSSRERGPRLGSSEWRSRAGRLLVTPSRDPSSGPDHRVRRAGSAFRTSLRRDR